jgi:hypothetical protein
MLMMSAVLLLTTPAAAETLSWEGVGPIRLGMGVKAAEQALKTKLFPRQAPFEDDQCYVTWRADGLCPSLGYVIERGKIAVIQIYSSDGRRLRSPIRMVSELAPRRRPSVRPTGR